MNHTPGPWEIEKLLDGNVCIGNFGDGNYLESARSFKSFKEEDAKLIALAPEMLAALREIANIERQSPYEMSNGAECANIANSILNKLEAA